MCFFHIVRRSKKRPSGLLGDPGISRDPGHLTPLVDPVDGLPSREGRLGRESTRSTRGNKGSI
jgi:hypothetical protein